MTAIASVATTRVAHVAIAIHVAARPLVPVEIMPVDTALVVTDAYGAVFVRGARASTAAGRASTLPLRSSP